MSQGLVSQSKLQNELELILTMVTVWRIKKDNARNVSFQTHNDGQFTVSTQLIISNHFVKERTLKLAKLWGCMLASFPTFEQTMW